MKPVTIVGGGLAGLALGIGLRRREIPVTIHEAGRYPRHRVCGEFISGRGQAALTRLGLRKLFEGAGAINATTAAFFSETKASASRKLPEPAICLSRFIIDAALAQEFRRLGGDLIEGDRWRGNFDDGIVCAAGRRAQVEANGWVGLKIHARNVTLTADLEMHISSRGYVGLCRLADGEVNVCGLFRRTNESADQASCEWLRGWAGSPLNERLASAMFDESSFCAVAGLCLQPQRASSRKECCAGDAITMIPPVTGNGMSMAFESAELAIEPLAAWSRGELSWAEAQQKIAHHCDSAFAKRLQWAKWLQRLMLTPALQNPLLMLMRSRWFWQMAFERTR